jgi:hypothetical protein
MVSLDFVIEVELGMQPCLQPSLRVNCEHGWTDRIGPK